MLILKTATKFDFEYFILEASVFYNEHLKNLELKTLFG